MGSHLLGPRAAHAYSKYAVDVHDPPLWSVYKCTNLTLKSLALRVRLAHSLPSCPAS